MRFSQFLAAALLVAAFPASAQASSAPKPVTATASLANGQFKVNAGAKSVGMQWYAPAMSGLTGPSFGGNTEMVTFWPRYQSGRRAHDLRITSVTVTKSDGTTWSARGNAVALGGWYSPAREGSTATITGVTVIAKSYRPVAKQGTSCRRPYLVRLDPVTLKMTGDPAGRKLLNLRPVLDDQGNAPTYFWLASQKSLKARPCRLVEVVAGQAVSSSKRAQDIAGANSILLPVRAGQEQQPPQLVALYAEVARMGE